MFGGRYIREDLNEAGFTGPSIVLPSDNPNIYDIFAQPRHLSATELTWKRFKASAQRHGVSFPSITDNELVSLTDAIVGGRIQRDIAKHIANERIHLTELTRPWSPKRNFFNSLDDLERTLVEQIRQEAPKESVIPEYDAHHACPDEGGDATMTVLQITLATEDDHPFDPRQTGPPTDCTAFSSEETLVAIRRFPAASSGGGTGLTPIDLRELLDTNESHEQGGLPNALAGLATHWARGKAPSSLASWITGAPLTALRKPKNDVRPIALGETLRRLVVSLLIHLNFDAIHRRLAPHQVGVATRNGTETIIHSVHCMVDRLGADASNGLLKLDLWNAFNLVSRSSFRKEVALYFPELRHWVDFCDGPRNNESSGRQTV